MRRRKILDTNHLSDATRHPSVVRDRIRAERGRGITFGTCVPVLCEQEVGFHQMKRPEEARQELRPVLRLLKIWPLEGDFASTYGEIVNDPRVRGRSLSTIDIMLAALCRQMDLVLLTSDRDFEALPDLRVENWIG